jgi:hypothetical protein
MKIYEFCMFHNEHAALEIKAAESAKWVDELHLCESSLTFRGGKRNLAIPKIAEFIRPHVFDAETHFHPPYSWGPSRHFPFFRKKDMARKNETLQRDHVHKVLADVADDDIVILSDVDEIIDARFADEIVDAVKKRSLVSVELHHTLFYLNLYSTNWHEVWPGSPKNYAYRVFAMTGARFRDLPCQSDRLRRLGEWNKLAGWVPLLHGFKGFHHSWLGDEATALDKLASYAHSAHEHRADLLDAEGNISPERVRELIRSRRSLFEGNQLEMRGFDEIEPLESVMAKLDKYRALLL